jgi:hypothetical protein
MRVKKFLFFLQNIFIYSALTCELCHKPNVKTSFNEADLVVVAFQVGYPIQAKNCGVQNSKESNYTKIKVTKILKGSLSEATELSVRACYGMCDYGLFLENNKEHVIFLRSQNNYFETLACKADELLLENGKITIDGKKVPLEIWMRDLSK